MSPWKYMLRTADAACRSKCRRFAVDCRGLITAALMAAAMVVASPAGARVASVEIDARYAFAGGRSYGSTGPYEVLVGRQRKSLWLA